MCFKRRWNFSRLFHTSSSSANGHVYSADDKKTHMSHKEIFTKYRLHIFVGLLFVVSLLFVSLGWYYRDKTRKDDLRNQKIFVDPRKRVLTLSDGQDEINVLIGQNLPEWQLPLHCQVHMPGNPNSKECVWKDNAVLSVQYFVAASADGLSSAQCYNVSWETLRPPRVPYDCFALGGAEWYGPSNQSQHAFPIRGSFDYVPTPYQLSNAGTFSSVGDLYWLSSSGVGLLLDTDNPLSLHWNNTVPGHLCVVSNYTGPLYGQASRNALPHMNYTLCNGPDPLTTHLIMKSMLRGEQEQSAPSDVMFSAPHWSVSGIARKADYDQADVKDIISKIKMYALNCSMLSLDGGWQRNHGDLTFDPDRFSNLTNMTDAARGTCSLALEVSPFFDYRSELHFHQGVDKELFVRDAGGEVLGLTAWEGGGAVALLDVSLPAAKAWFNSLLTALTRQSGARALRLSYGREGWLPYRPTFSQPDMSPSGLLRQMSDMMASHTTKLILEHTSRSQSLPGVIAVSTDIQVRDGRSCLVNTIEKALTLGLLGYPYVMADGFSASASTEHPSQDLFTRWMQLAAFFPAYKFSVAPWTYDEDTLSLARNLSKVHSEQVARDILQSAELKAEVAQGLPVLRPVWWEEPDSPAVHARRVRDQFLVGGALLVAPVLCEGVRARDVYVPRGVWKDKVSGSIVIGPRLLPSYPVPANTVIHFHKMTVYDEEGGQ